MDSFLLKYRNVGGASGNAPTFDARLWCALTKGTLEKRCAAQGVVNYNYVTKGQAGVDAAL